MIAICIPAHKPRLGELVECLSTMRDPGFKFLIVTNEPDPISPLDLPDEVEGGITTSEEVNL